jgi:hypothetical protein
VKERPRIDMSIPDPVTDLEKLRFYREEITHEFNLLAMRSTMLITCQSFLIVPFAILNTAVSFRWATPPLAMVTVLGFVVAFWLLQPLAAADRTITKWMIKQRELFDAAPHLRTLAIDRDLIPGVSQDLTRDLEHQRSMTFSRRAPYAFMAFWICAMIWIAVRALFHP